MRSPDDVNPKTPDDMAHSKRDGWLYFTPRQLAKLLCANSSPGNPGAAGTFIAFARVGGPGTLVRVPGVFRSAPQAAAALAGRPGRVLPVAGLGRVRCARMSPRPPAGDP